MSRLSVWGLPSVAEGLLYLRNNGPRRALAKLVSAYVVGRQTWYLTCEDLTRYVGVHLAAQGFEIRAAGLDDLPAMQTFTTRMSRQTLRAWCGRDYHFFIALHDGVPVSYRCLSRLVHPGVDGFVRLAPHQIFMVDEFTVPEFRRRGITRQLAVAMTPRLTARGFSEVLGIHRVDNQDTIAAARAKGIPRIGTVIRHRMFGRTSFAYEPASDVATAWNGADLGATAPVDLTAPLAGREAA